LRGFTVEEDEFVDEGYLVDLIWKDGLGEICRIEYSVHLKIFEGIKLEITI